MKKAIVAGATGLIGSELLKILLASDRYSEVIALTRHELGIQHPKLTELKVDFSVLDQYTDQLVADDIFCCLGTTMAKAKTKEKFYEVDFTYPLRLGVIAKLNEAKQYLLVSALGANKNSSIYYNQVKGEVEEAISNLGFNTLHVIRPSLLLGARGEKRSAEEAAKVVYKYLGFLIPEKYKGIEAVTVARAMLEFAKQERRGSFIHESRDLQAYSL
jgi:uncharacterized protein YbjT (DUF2867 family)